LAAIKLKLRLQYGLLALPTWLAKVVAFVGSCAMSIQYYGTVTLAIHQS
jgi:hypothetical protein